MWAWVRITASIEAGAGSSSPITGGTDPTIQLDAGFNVLNMQFGDGATMSAPARA